MEELPADAGGRFTATAPAGLTIAHAENSEVVALASVDVAVITSPADGPATEKLKAAFPLVSVPRLVRPRKVAPSPNPLALQEALEKNSMMYVALGTPFSVPTIAVVPFAIWAELITG